MKIKSANNKYIRKSLPAVLLFFAVILNLHCPIDFNYEGEYREEYFTSEVPVDGGTTGGGGNTIVSTTADSMVLDGNRDSAYDSSTTKIEDPSGDDSSGYSGSDIKEIVIVQDTTYLWTYIEFYDGPVEATPSSFYRIGVQLSGVPLELGYQYDPSSGNWNLDNHGTTAVFAHGTGIEVRSKKSELPGVFSFYYTIYRNVAGEKYDTTTVSGNMIVTPPPPVAVTGVTLNKDETTIPCGYSDYFIATITPADATNQGLTWTTSDQDIATVNPGVVIANSSKAGTAVFQNFGTFGSNYASKDSSYRVRAIRDF